MIDIIYLRPYTKCKSPYTGSLDVPRFKFRRRIFSRITGSGIRLGQNQHVCDDK